MSKKFNVSEKANSLRLCLNFPYPFKMKLNKWLKSLTYCDLSTLVVRCDCVMTLLKYPSLQILAMYGAK